MAQPQKNTRFIARVLYRLKHRYGAKVTFVRDTDQGLDTKTGKKNVQKQTWDFRFAIIMPNVQKQAFVYDLAYIAGNKNFTEGGIFDTSKRRLILDAKDLRRKGYVPQQRDYFTYDGDRWNVIEVHKFELNTGYVIVGQRVEGSPPRNVVNAKAQQRCIFEQDVEVTI